MADRNITEVYLLNVPLENDYRHTIWFPDQATQESYFLDESRVKKVYTDFSYLRKDGIIRVDVDYDSVVSLGVNYVAYRNKAYSNKWFYAFITNIEYKNDGRTDIHIETDVMQTWHFNHTVQASYIEREHCFNDTAGVNTQPEDLETGEYVTNSVVKNGKLSTGYIVIGSTVDMTATTGTNSAGATVYPSDIGGTYGGTYSGCKYYFAASADGANTLIKRLDSTGQGDAITSLFMFPAEMLKSHISGTGQLLTSDVPMEMVWGDGAIKRCVSLQGYTPNNNKLLTYPYCYLMLANNGGSEVNYRYELFEYPDDAELSDQNCEFKIYGTLAAGGSIRLVPLKYSGENENYLKGLTAAKYPICSWANDVYTNWLTQNSINLDISKERGQLAVRSADISGTMSAVNGVMGVIGSAVTGNVGGAINSGVNAVGGVMQSDIAKANGLLDIKSVAAQKYQQSLNPPESKGTLNAGDVTYAMDMCTFTAHQMSIKAEYARIIDKYFDMYGYATNLVKTPYKNHRESYWFTKTIAANVDAAIPNVDLNIIKQCYNNGITFWRHTKTVGDYSQSNNIVK